MAETTPVEASFESKNFELLNIIFTYICMVWFDQILLSKPFLVPDYFDRSLSGLGTYIGPFPIKEGRVQKVNLSLENRNNNPTQAHITQNQLICFFLAYHNRYSQFFRCICNNMHSGTCEKNGSIMFECTTMRGNTAILYVQTGDQYPSSVQLKADIYGI